MKRTRSIFQIALVTIFTPLVFLSGVLFFTRWRLPYNDEGRYFDTESGVVYQKQSVEVFFVAFVILSFLMTATIIWRVKTTRR